MLNDIVKKNVHIVNDDNTSIDKNIVSNPLRQFSKEKKKFVRRKQSLIASIDRLISAMLLLLYQRQHRHYYFSV